MNRRQLLSGAGAMIASQHLVLPAASQGRDPTTPLERAAFDAYIYTLPLIESARARAGWIGAGGKVGSILHMRAPTTPATQRITTPNNDTLNSRAWIDLAQGPVRLSWPGTGARYISVAMMDMYSNNFAILGSRNTGPDGGSVLIVGPDVAAPPGAVRSPTRWMWVLIRLLTFGGDDVGRANAIQDAYRIDAPRFDGPVAPAPAPLAPWQEYFASAGRLMVENPGPAMDEGMRRRIGPLQLDRFDPASFDPQQAREIASGVDRARQLLRAQSVKGPIVAGWAYTRSNIGAFGQDYLYRAQTALNGFAALPPEEAMYVAATGTTGDMKLDSAVPWRLRLAGDDLPPTDAFWSLAMYRATPEGQFYFFDNPIDRYSIGDRTAGLYRETDGSIEILMQRDRPRAYANWLPTPRDTPFGLVFRIYRPRPAALNGEWRLPALQRVQ